MLIFQGVYIVEMDDRILKIDLDSVIMWLQQHVSNEEHLLGVVYTDVHRGYHPLT